MNTAKRKKRDLKDRKNPFVYAFWTAVNKICLTLKFKNIEITGRENLPESGPFLLVSNHCSRWDGLLIYELINRPANFMVSPNELAGAQGAVLSSMGSFPADPRADLIGHSLKLFAKGEGIVIFPEGDIYRNGSTQKFKTGAAKICFAALEAGIDLPVFPAAISYDDENKIARVSVGQAVSVAQYSGKLKQESYAQELRLFSDRLHREVSFLRNGLGYIQDRLALFFGQRRPQTNNQAQSGLELVSQQNPAVLKETA